MLRITSSLLFASSAFLQVYNPVAAQKIAQHIDLSIGRLALVAPAVSGPPHLSSSTEHDTANLNPRPGLVAPLRSGPAKPKSPVPLFTALALPKPPPPNPALTKPAVVASVPAPLVIVRNVVGFTEPNADAVLPRHELRTSRPYLLMRLDLKSLARRGSLRPLIDFRPARRKIVTAASAVPPQAPVITGALPPAFKPSLETKRVEADLGEELLSLPVAKPQHFRILPHSAATATKRVKRRPKTAKRSLIRRARKKTRRTARKRAIGVRKKRLRRTARLTPNSTRAHKKTRRKRLNRNRTSPKTSKQASSKTDKAKKAEAEATVEDGKKAVSKKAKKKKKSKSSRRRTRKNRRRLQRRAAQAAKRAAAKKKAAVLRKKRVFAVKKKRYQRPCAKSEFGYCL